MGFLRHCARSIAVCLVPAAVLLTCGAPPVPPEAPPPHRPETRTIPVWIDPDFTPDQTILVVQSAMAWQRASGGRIRFAFSTGGLRIHRATDPDEVRRLEQSGAAANGCDPERVVGLARGQDAYLITGKLEQDWQVYATSVHEMGHLLGLPHYDPCGRDGCDGGEASDDSWMHPSIDRAPKGTREIPIRDAAALRSALGR